MRFVAGRGAVAERHREAAAGRGAAEKDAAGKEDARLHREAAAGKEDARLHREAAAGRGAVAAEMLLSRTLLAEKSKAASRSCCWQRRRKAASGSCCWQGTPEWTFTSLVRHA